MEQSLQKEYLIRGRIIEISSTIESLVARLILLVNISNPDKNDNIPFKSMNYNGKLLKLIKLFKLYYENDYTQNLEVFEKLDSIKEFRNRVAHCIFKWNDPSLMSFEIIDADILEDGTHHFASFKYSIQDCFKKIDEFKDATISLLKLTIKIEDDLGQKIPGFLELIRPVRNESSN